LPSPYIRLPSGGQTFTIDNLVLEGCKHGQRTDPTSFITIGSNVTVNKLTLRDCESDCGFGAASTGNYIQNNGTLVNIDVLGGRYKFGTNGRFLGVTTGLKKFAAKGAQVRERELGLQHSHERYRYAAIHFRGVRGVWDVSNPCDQQPGQGQPQGQLLGEPFGRA
jgi:hypothetical protein